MSEYKSITTIQPANEKPETSAINTQQTEEQKATLVDNGIAEKGGEQEVKRCFGKHKEQSEFQKMATTLSILDLIGTVSSMSIFAASTAELISKEEDSFYKFTLGSSFADLCKDICCLAYIGAKLLKYKRNNKEIKTETMDKNDKNTLKKSNKIQIEMVPKEDKQTKSEIEIRESQNQVETITFLNSVLEDTFNLSKKSKKQQKQ